MRRSRKGGLNASVAPRLMRRRWRRRPAAAVWLIAVGLLPVGPAGAFPDSYTGRLEAALVIETLNGELLSHDSATQTLQRWCAQNQIASPAEIMARRVEGQDKPATAEIRARLHAAAEEPIAYRRVALSCGGVVLSNADNWYRPQRLTEAMNQRLETTQTPFGLVVKSLDFRRRTLDVEALFKPLGENWRGAPRPKSRRGTLSAPGEVLRHRAILETPDGEPFSLVVETYTAGVLRRRDPTHPPSPGS